MWLSIQKKIEITYFMEEDVKFTLRTRETDIYNF